MDSDRARGMLLGLACGDALGRPVEFTSASEISAEHGRLDEMVGHGTWNQPAGTITDDTEQALCIARSLVEHQTFGPADVADRFVAWYDSGPFDIGRMTMRSLSRLKHGDTWDDAGQHVWEQSREGQNAGNRERDAVSTARHPVRDGLGPTRRGKSAVLTDHAR